MIALSDEGKSVQSFRHTTEFGRTDRWNVGLKIRPVSEQKSQSCRSGVVKHGSCYARRHNDLEGVSNFSSTIYSFSTMCLEYDYCGDQQWPGADLTGGHSCSGRGPWEAGPWRPRASGPQKAKFWLAIAKS